MKIISTIGYVVVGLTMAAVVGECMRRNPSSLSFLKTACPFANSSLQASILRTVTHSASGSPRQPLSYLRIRKNIERLPAMFRILLPSCCSSPKQLRRLLFLAIPAEQFLSSTPIPRHKVTKISTLFNMIDPFISALEILLSWRRI
jgi:hypothetical protein